MAVTIEDGFKPTERETVARLYWQAFGAKLGKLMGPDHKAIAFLTNNVSPHAAVVARDTDGALLGVAGYKTADGAFVGGDLRDLAAVYGWLSTLWRAPLLALVERDLKDGVLLMDGICVAEVARGQGVGTLLLEAIKRKAEVLGCETVRLDVIETNPRARALYERQGFTATSVEELGPFSTLFGFTAATTMLWKKPDAVVAQ